MTQPSYAHNIADGWPYPDDTSAERRVDDQLWWNRTSAQWREFQSQPSPLDRLLMWCDKELDEEYLLDGVVLPSCACYDGKECARCWLARPCEVCRNGKRQTDCICPNRSGVIR